ncbi:hypothetical protein D9M68_458590 [compost metagenome]
MGYSTRARTAAGRFSPSRCGLHFPFGDTHQGVSRYPASGFDQLTASRDNAAMMGNMKLSVLPEPVPDVTMPGCPGWIPR